MWRQTKTHNGSISLGCSLRGKFLAIQVYVKEQEKSQSKNMPKGTKIMRTKPKVSRRNIINSIKTVYENKRKKSD